jgi:hypothetical protein
LLNEPPPHAHAVQFYDDEPFLFETVRHFLSAGLAAGEAALLIATPDHTHGVLSKMRRDVCERAIASGQLLLVDADAMLARFMRGDEPVESAFELAVARLFEGLFAGNWASEAAAQGWPRRVRAFGEMVDLLWKRGNSAAALRLEALWNRAMARHDLVLLCGYGMRNFYKADDGAAFGEVCRQHTHVMPTEHFAMAGGDVFERLREISMLEQRARSLDSEVAYRAELEAALLATIEERAARAPRGRAGASLPAAAGRPSRLRAPVQALVDASRSLRHLLRATRARVARR